MQLADFRRMIDRMTGDIPASYLEGITEIEVSPREVPHPEREGVYTMGECIPIDLAGEHSPSHIVLYFGSFAALARDQRGFDWRGEAWETLTHELRHHLEWKANARDLDEYDWAAEEGFARVDEDAFDPCSISREKRLEPDTYQVDDNVFWTEGQGSAHLCRIRLGGAAVPSRGAAESLPLYLTVTGVADPPAGHLTLVFRRKPGNFRPPSQPGGSHRTRRPRGTCLNCGHDARDQTTLKPSQVLDRAKSFFAERVPLYGAFLEKEGPSFATFRGQGGEEIVIAAFDGTGERGFAPRPCCSIRRWTGSFPFSCRQPRLHDCGWRNEGTPGLGA